MSETSFTRGSLCLVGEGVDMNRAAIVAEVYSATTIPDQGLVACYFLAHELEAAEAESAMNFFSAQPSLLVDVARLVEDSGADYPALVAIRYVDEIQGFLYTANEFGILREMPDDEIVSRAGWDLFWAQDSIAQGRQVPEADPVPPFDYRILRRKVLAMRASTFEDRDPWMVEEYERLRRLTHGSPEGCEKFVALAEDIHAAMTGSVPFTESFSVVIPTTVERQRQFGAIMDWVPQTGREIVVAHGLDAIQAARVLAVVREDVAAFVSEAQLLHGAGGRESLGDPIVIPDTGLNWISTDFTGRRNPRGQEILRSRLNALGSDAAAVAVQPSISR